MSAANGHSNGNGNGRKGNGHKAPGRNEIASTDRRKRAVELFLSGKLAPAIAEELQCSERSVYYDLQAARLQLIAEKKAHFNERLALMLDGVFDQLECVATRLSDPRFLETAAPERLDVLYRGFGILSDKCFVLLAAGPGRFTQSGQQPTGETDTGADGR